MEDSEVQALDDLKGQTLGVTLGETHEKWAREQGGWDIRTYKGLPELLLELKSGRLDAIVVDNIPVRVAIKETGDKLRMLDTPDIEGGAVAIGIAIRQEQPRAESRHAGSARRDDGRTAPTRRSRWNGSAATYADPAVTIRPARFQRRSPRHAPFRSFRMDFSLMVRVFPFFLEAALVTVQISALALVLGLAAGSLGAAAKTVPLSHRSQ